MYHWYEAEFDEGVKVKLTIHHEVLKECTHVTYGNYFLLHSSFVHLLKTVLLFWKLHTTTTFNAEKNRWAREVSGGLTRTDQPSGESFCCP